MLVLPARPRLPAPHAPHAPHARVRGLRLLRLLCQFCLFCLFCQPLALLVPTVARAAEPLPLVYGFDPEFPPFSFERDGVPAGFDVDLLQAVFQGQNVKVDMRPLAWERIQLELSSGAVHLTSGMAKTEQRQALYAFSDQPSARLEARLFTRPDRRVGSMEALRGKAVAVERGTLYQKMLEQFGGIIIRAFPSQREGLKAASEGQTEAFCGADKTALYYIRKLPIPNLSPMGQPVSVMPIFFAAAKDRPEIKTMLDQGMRRALTSGDYATLYRKWFIPDLDQGEMARLAEAAKAALPFAHAPYSRNPRAAAAMGFSGSIQAGAVVEHATPQLGASAARVAVLKMVSTGETDIKAVVEVDKDGKVVAPAGETLDLLLEFGLSAQAVLETEPGKYVSRSLMELMPFNRPRTPGRETQDFWLERGGNS